MDKQNTINFFKKNGYIILRNVYSNDQILRYRKFIKNKIQESLGLEKKKLEGLRKSKFQRYFKLSRVKRRNIKQKSTRKNKNLT